MVARRQSYAALAAANKSKPKKPKGLLYFLFGTSCGQLMMLGVWGAIIVIGGALALATTRPKYATSHPPGLHDEDHLYNYQSFTQCIWFAWGMLMPLPASSLAPNETGYTKFVAVFFSLLGFLYNLCCLGVVVDRLRWGLGQSYLSCCRWQLNALVCVSLGHVAARPQSWPGIP